MLQFAVAVTVLMIAHFAVLIIGYIEALWVNLWAYDQYVIRHRVLSDARRGLRVLLAIVGLTHVTAVQAQQNQSTLIDETSIQEPHKETTLMGLVVDDATGKPIADVVLAAVSRNFEGRRDTSATTNRDGGFMIARDGGAVVIQALSADGKMGAIVEVPLSVQDTTIRLLPLGSATGRLVLEDRKTPVRNQKIHYGIDIKNEQEGIHEFFSRYGGVVTTDVNGEFKLPDLVPHARYECRIHIGDRQLPLVTAKVRPGQSVEMGDLRRPQRHIQTAPPTLDERLVQYFDAPGTVQERFDKVSNLVALSNQNLLVLLGDPADVRVQNFFRLYFNDTQFSAYREDFRLLAIATDGRHLQPAQQLAEKLNVNLSDGREAFHVLVLNPSSQLVASGGIQQLCDNGKIAAERVFDLLDPHRIQILDAQTLLDDAIRQAAQQNKRVLVQETGTACAPCHALSRLLASNRQWEQDYVWVKIDSRWTGANRVMRKLYDGPRIGIPWLAILDATGKPLVTSNMPDTKDNIGYPSDYLAREHFANMFKLTRQHMSDTDIDRLVVAAQEQY
jgi:hypothetical protein